MEAISLIVKGTGILALNGVAYNFSLPVQKRNEPYNLFAISGRDWNNFSIDYSYTHRNLHFFGEVAADKNLNKAILNGLLISVDPHVDLSFMQRAIDKRYQAVYGNAFTENTYPTNENGIYAGISLKPMSGWRLDMYADLYRFPWLQVFGRCTRLWERFYGAGDICTQQAINDLFQVQK